MAQVSFGTVLREARERKGYDVQSAARRLRIRPDILRAIENNDFSRLPARGYTRNMVNAYARLVGLNPGDITRMYLDEAYAYQVGRTRGESESPAHVSGRRSVSHHDSRQAGSRSRDEARTGTRRGERPREGERTERMQPSHRSRSQRSSSRSRERNAGYPGTLAQRAARAENESRRGARVGEAVTTQFTNFYSGSQVRGSQGNQTRLPYVVVAAVILVLLVIIIAMAFGNHGGTSSTEVAKVPITGVTDTSADGSGTSESNASQSTQTDSKSTSTATVPTSVKVEYKLASGQQAYVVITQDGQATEQMLTGPVDQTVEVSGTWSLATWVSSGFTVTMDGKDVEFANDATTGMPTASVNFKDYLASWAKDHPDVKVEGLDDASTASSSATSASTNGSTASATSANGTSTQSGSAGTAVNTGSTSSSGTGTSSTNVTSTYGSTSTSTGGGSTSSYGSGTGAGTSSSTSTYY